MIISKELIEAYQSEYRNLYEKDISDSSARKRIESSFVFMRMMLERNGEYLINQCCKEACADIEKQRDIMMDNMEHIVKEAELEVERVKDLFDESEQIHLNKNQLNLLNFYQSFMDMAKKNGVSADEASRGAVSVIVTNNKVYVAEETE